MRGTMHISDVEDRVSESEEVKDDPESAHMYEDSLYEDVLRWIASGDDDAADLARAALKSKGIAFQRWTA